MENITIAINLDTLSSNGIKAILDVANDCWANTQGISMSCDYGDITVEQADKKIFDCCKQVIEFVKIANMLDENMHIKQHNIEEKRLAAVQNREPNYINGIQEYPERCYIQFAIEEYNSICEAYGEEKYVSPWSKDDVDNNYDAHWEDTTDELFGDCKKHIEKPKHTEPKYLSEEVVVENLGSVKLEDIVFNNNYSVAMDAEASDCYYWINNPNSAENLGFTVVDNDTFTLYSEGITKTFKVTENTVNNYSVNGIEYIQSGKVTAKEI